MKLNLWIRSQDRNKLIKFNGVVLTPSGCSIYPIGLNGTLGTYESEYRAKEVIDEIQDVMLCKFSNNAIYDNSYDDDNQKNVV